MATTGKTTVDGSTTDSFALEPRELHCHPHAQALQSMTESQHELRHIIETMQTDVAEKRIFAVGHDVLLERALAAIAKIKATAEMAKKNLPVELTQQHLQSLHDKVIEAFHIPEIAENILSNLGAEDLLRAQQVDRNMFNTIQGSPVLQRNVFLKSRLTGPFAMLPSNDTVLFHNLASAVPISGFGHRQSPLFHRVTAMVDDHAMNTISGVHPTPNTGSMILFLKSDHRLIEGALGPKVESMFVCQPPVHVMQVIMPCSKCKGPDMKAPKDSRGNFVLMAEHGITIGHVVETTKTLRRLHHSCWSTMRDRVVKKNRKENHPLPADQLFDKFPLAREYVFWPQFYTMVALEHDDSILLRWREGFKKLDAEDTRRVLWTVGMYTRTSCIDREDADSFV